MKKIKQFQKANLYNLRESSARIEQALCKQASMNTQKVNTKDNPTLINYMQGYMNQDFRLLCPSTRRNHEGINHQRLRIRSQREAHTRSDEEQIQCIKKSKESSVPGIQYNKLVHTQTMEDRQYMLYRPSFKSVTHIIPYNPNFSCNSRGFFETSS